MEKRCAWHGETLIAGIGQGYMLATPVQLAAATATLANKGVKVQPHLLKEVRTSTNELTNTLEPVKTRIDLRKNSYWDAIHESMKRVVHGNRGTARATGYGLKYKMAGKTGTAQVFGIAQDEEYDAETVAKKLRDHALFIAFAPYEKPVIAVAVIAENGEHGSAIAPVARKVIDAYLNMNDKVSDE
jgi:penicillin-binding protein 2